LFDGKVVLIYRRRPRLRLPHAVRDVASAHALQTRTREARIVDLCGLQESGSCVLIVKAAHNLVVVNAEAAADHRPALAEGHPGEAKARREIMKRRVSGKNASERGSRVREDIRDVCLPVVLLVGNRYELMPDAEIERQGIVDLEVILKVVADERLPELRSCTVIQRKTQDPGRTRLSH